MTTPPGATPVVPLRRVLREWGRIGVVGFGGPPAHIRLLRELCVERRGWIDAEGFEDALAACNLLPGPASTQLSIYCAWRVRGRVGATVGGLAFIVPGLVLIIALSAVFLADAPPTWLAGAAAGAGAAVAAVALHAGLGLAPSSWRRARARVRWSAYASAGALGAAIVGPWVLVVLLASGAIELAVQRAGAWRHDGTHASAIAPLLAVAAGAGSLGGLAWMAFKVGALSYGGGFVIVPLMEADAVERFGWLSPSQFLTAVALGQVTPGPVVHTVAVVGYGAAGLGGALLAAAIAFAPSFAVVLVLAPRFDAFRRNEGARAFLDGSGPAAIGAILGSAVPLALALAVPWQLVVLAAAGGALFLVRAPVVVTILGAAAAGVAIALLGGPLPT